MTRRRDTTPFLLVGRPTTYQQKGKPLHIYGEWPDPLIPRSGEVVFVEGETDTWTQWFHYGPSDDVK
jgi:hypothetical protein